MAAWLADERPLARSSWQEQLFQMPLRHRESGNTATGRASSSSALRGTPSLHTAMPAVGFTKTRWNAEHSYRSKSP